MAFEFDLNKVKESLVYVGKEVESKAKDVSAMAKIKIDIHNKEVFLEKQYALLGKAFYEAHKDEDVEEQVYFTSIKEAEAELAQLNADLLAAQGSVECPSCKSKQPQNNAYCAYCGTELNKSEEV
jgi:hypothetical protein